MPDAADIDRLRKVLTLGYSERSPDSGLTDQIIPKEPIVEVKSIQDFDDSDLIGDMEDYEQGDDDINPSLTQMYQKSMTDDDGELAPGYYRDENGIIRTSPQNIQSITPSEDKGAKLWAKNENEEFDMAHSRIMKYFGLNLMKFLYCFATSYDYTKNNMKAEVISWVVRHSGDFEELGTGTNRIAFINGKYVYKIALDRRGLVDNASEFMMSPREEDLLANSYETNLVVLVQEYCNTIDYDTFKNSRGPVLQALEILDKRYILGDMGYTLKNMCNIGFDENDNVKFLDYAYMHPKYGNATAMSCPKCNIPLQHNVDFSAYQCPNCHRKFSYMDINRRLNRELQETDETRYCADIRNLYPIDDDDVADQADEYVKQVVDYVLEQIKIEKAPK